MERREYRLREALEPLGRKYAVILVDCSPSLGLLTINALCAAKKVLVPLQCEYYALEGVTQLVRTIELVQSGLNPSLEIEGVLLTMFDPRNNLSHQVASEIRSHFKKGVFDTVIPRNVRLSESPSHGRPVLLYDERSSGAQAYEALAGELLKKWGKGARSAG
jgi:chromosome partitioning protein